MKDFVVFGLMSIVFLASLVGLALAPETNSKRRVCLGLSVHRFVNNNRMKKEMR